MSARVAPPTAPPVAGKAPKGIIERPNGTARAATPRAAQHNTPPAQVYLLTMEIIDDSTPMPMAETRSCRICGIVGHLARNCPSAPAETRTCRVCGAVGHIARNCPDQDGAQARQDSRRCHVCGEVGHIARNCPNATADTAVPEGGRRKKGGAAGRRCFNCGKTGHLSADCDLPAGNMACYNCGEIGHKSADCPN